MIGSQNNSCFPLVEEGAMGVLLGYWKWSWYFDFSVDTVCSLCTIHQDVIWNLCIVFMCAIIQERGFRTKWSRESEFYPYIIDSMCNEVGFMGSTLILTLTEVSHLHLTQINSRIDTYKRNHMNDYKNVIW